MKLYCLLRGKTVPDIIYNHAIVYDEVESLVYEADYPRVVRMKLDEWKGIRKNKTAEIKTIDVNFSFVENRDIQKYLDCQIGKRYEVINFLWHAVKVFTGKWYGKRKDDRHYCYKLVINSMNRSWRFCEDPYMNPIEFWEKFVKK
jgi:hypothetical protein